MRFEAEFDLKRNMLIDNEDENSVEILADENGVQLNVMVDGICEYYP